MTAPRTLRSLAAALFAVCLGFVALPGCGPDKKADPKKDEAKDKKDDPKPGDPNAPKGDGTTPPKPDAPPKSTLGAVEKDAEVAADAFRRSVLDGTVKADMLSAAFVKATGKPMVFPNDSDKGRGYQPGVAESWLKQVGSGIGWGPELKREQAGDVAYFRGALQKPGGYCLRMVKEGGAWKADWLSVSSVEGTVATTPTPEGAAQAFAVASFVELATDAGGMQPGERAVVLAAALTPALRTAWAATPFDTEKAAGIDYHPPALVRKAGNEIGNGASAYTAARVGDLPEFKVELTKPAGKKTYTVKLVKGAAAHEWLVSEVSEAKG